MDWGGSVLQGVGGTLAPHIPLGSVSDSVVAGVLGNKLVTLGGSLLPMFIYTVCILFWG
jgi:hypothetical protein